MNQLDLFEPRPGLLGRTHPDTSAAAAERVAPRTGTQRRAILDRIRRAGAYGATDLELQEGVPLNGNSERPRRVELVDAGWIEDSGRRRNGHIVWVARP